MDTNTAFEARQRRETRTAYDLGVKFLTALKASDSDRMDSIQRQFNAMLPFPGEYGAATEERARLLEAFNDGSIPSRRRGR